MSYETDQLRRQINTDQRVIQLANSRRQGSLPGVVTAAELRQFGYDVPNDWKYSSAGGGGRRQAGVFEENDWGDLVANLGAAGVGGYAAIANAAAGGASAAANAGGAAGGTLPSSTIPNAHLAVPGAIGSQGASAGIGAGIGAGAGAANTIANAANGGNGGGVPDWLQSFLSPQGVLGLAGLIPALAGAGQNDPLKDPLVREQLELAKQRQQMENTRYQRVDPLHETVTRVAYSMLPTASRDPNSPLNVPWDRTKR